MHKGDFLCTFQRMLDTNNNGRLLMCGACHYSFLANDYSKTIGFKISGLYLIYEKLDSLLHGFKIIFNRREHQVAIDVEVAVSYVVALMT